MKVVKRFYLRMYLLLDSMELQEKRQIAHERLKEETTKIDRMRRTSMEQGRQKCASWCVGVGKYLRAQDRLRISPIGRH